VILPKISWKKEEKLEKKFVAEKIIIIFLPLLIVLECF
jgi:hypothetical protein